MTSSEKQADENIEKYQKKKKKIRGAAGHPAPLNNNVNGTVYLPSCGTPAPAPSTIISLTYYFSFEYRTRIMIIIKINHKKGNFFLFFIILK